MHKNNEGHDLRRWNLNLILRVVRSNACSNSCLLWFWFSSHYHLSCSIRLMAVARSYSISPPERNYGRITCIGSTQKRMHWQRSFSVHIIDNIDCAVCWIRIKNDQNKTSNNSSYKNIGLLGQRNPVKPIPKKWSEAAHIQKIIAPILTYVAETKADSENIKNIGSVLDEDLKKDTELTLVDMERGDNIK